MACLKQAAIASDDTKHSADLETILVDGDFVYTAADDGKIKVSGNFWLLGIFNMKYQSLVSNQQSFCCLRPEKNTEEREVWVNARGRIWAEIHCEKICKPTYFGNYLHSPYFWAVLA